MIVTGINGTASALGSQLMKDFTGPGNFLYFSAAILAVGALGYIDALKQISRLFMALILIVVVLANRGFFKQFTAALKTGPIAPTLPAGDKWDASQTLPTQMGRQGQAPTSSGEAKFFGWMNYFFGDKSPLPATGG